MLMSMLVALVISGLLLFGVRTMISNAARSEMQSVSRTRLEDLRSSCDTVLTWLALAVVVVAIIWLAQR